MKCLKESFGSYVETDPTCQRCKEYFPLVFQLCQGVVKLVQQSKPENVSVPNIPNSPTQTIETQITNNQEEEVDMEMEVVQVSNEEKPKKRGRKGDELVKKFRTLFREIASKAESRDDAISRLYEEVAKFSPEELRTLLVKISMWLLWYRYKAK